MLGLYWVLLSCLVGFMAWCRDGLIKKAGRMCAPLYFYGGGEVWGWVVASSIKGEGGYIFTIF